MTYTEFYARMVKIGAVSENWRNVLKLLDSTVYEQKDEILKVLILYFSLLDDGNVYMLLDQETTEKTFSKKIEGLRIRDEKEDDPTYEELISEIRTIAANLNVVGASSVISGDGKDGLFVIRDNKLYTRKNFNAVIGILERIHSLFPGGASQQGTFSWSTALREDFVLSEEQKDVAEKGIGTNLLITGGPGTGKTTSILFLLLSLLTEHPDSAVYLTAPSGKAASRMKDSILSGIRQLGDTYQQEHSDIIGKIKDLNEYTIHRLLNYAPAEHGFSYKKTAQFAKDAIFVIDEASMIDLSIFASLLEAIPDEARVFMMGDRDQLPSVECGAVFGALLELPELQDHIVRLKKSRRFPDGSEIHKLSAAINSGDSLEFIKDKWKDWQEFDPEQESGEMTPVYYYLDQCKNQREMVESVVSRWYGKFYKADTDIRQLCTELHDAGEELKSQLDTIWKAAENARILCTSNEGSRGVDAINQMILKQHYAKQKKYAGFYAGELLMITKNNKGLDLYNGDCGITVAFEGDETLYFMLSKSTNLKLDEKKLDNRIFQLGEYLFYPIRLISTEDLQPAFAITVHKSQGSDYNNILVILPRAKGHPLLNRQIVYTAITRTKKNTYILSNQENLEASAENVIERNTL